MRVVILVSGGLDSASLVSFARSEVEVVGLFVDYGQPAAIPEREAARVICPDLIERTVELDCAAMLDDPSEPGPRVVPGRNLVLLSMGINVALSHKCSEVWLGATAGDESEYIDCRGVFADGVNLVSLLLGIGVRYPFHKLTKAQVLDTGRQHSADLERTWSCYSPLFEGSTYEPCGGCNACTERTQEGM